MCMCVHGGEGGRSRACSGKFSRRSATLSAQVRACDKTLRLHSYTFGSGVSAANAARQLINESPALEENGLLDGPGDLFHKPCTPDEGHVPLEDKDLRQAADGHCWLAFLRDVPQLCPNAGAPSLSLRHSSVSNGPGSPLAKGISLSA